MWLELAKVYHDLGNLDEALNSCQRVLELDPESTAGKKERARIEASLAQVEADAGKEDQ